MNDSLDSLLAAPCAEGEKVIITDSNVHRLWGSLMTAVPVIEVEAGERSKSLEGAAFVWNEMVRLHVTRASLVINIGGGVVTDLGGFCAATFKRGLDFINVPTTLLGMADAAIGGKTGIDFAGAKNEVGVFRMPGEVIVDGRFLSTLPESEILNGLAEVVKTLFLINTPEALNALEVLLAARRLPGVEELGRLAAMAADYKKEIVAQDPLEKGIRRMLNFGHTYGHAYESRAAELGVPLPHGFAVAHGILPALETSIEKNGYPSRWLPLYRDFLARFYPPLPPEILADPSRLRLLMSRDKKNRRFGQIEMLLLTP